MFHPHRPEPKAVVKKTHCLASLAYGAYELHHSADMIFLVIVVMLVFHEAIEFFLGE